MERSDADLRLRVQEVAQKSFEIEQRITEAPLTDCECGGTVRRIIQPVGIAFKGSGFYVNESSTKPTEKAAETKTDVEDRAEEGSRRRGTARAGNT